jgi:tetratricopeptide (TPR) repeat protein
MPTPSIRAGWPGACSVVSITALSLAIMTSPLAASAQPDTTGGRVESGLAPELSLDEKIAQLNAKILAEPRVAEHYNDLGVLYTQKEDWPLARDAFIRAVQAQPQMADYHRNLGLVFLKVEDYELAAAEFETYKNLGMGGDRDGWRLTGRARELGGDPDGAVAAYDEGLAALGRQPLAEVMRLAAAKARVLQEAGQEEALRKLLEEYQPVAREFRRTATATDPPGVEGVAEAEAIEHNLVVMYLENGKILEESDLPAEAAELYARIHELAPERDDLLPRLVDAHLAAGDVVAARTAADLARQRRPEATGTWIASGKIAEQAGDLDGAVTAYRRAYEIDPATPGLSTVIGNLYMKLGRSAEGREFLAPAIDDPNTPPEVVYNYAVSLMQEKKYQAALPSLRRVVRERPDFAAGWAALGQALRGSDQFAAAIEPYQKALELAPDARVAYNLGVWSPRGPTARTSRWRPTSRPWPWIPPSSRPGTTIGLALMKAERHEDALAALVAAQKLEPASYRIFLNQGVALYKLKRYQEAIEKYNLALEQKVTAEAYDNMGLAYQDLGNKERAQTLFREAKALRGER